MKNKKTIAIIITILIMILINIPIAIYLIKDQTKSITIEATISLIGTDYLLVTSNNQDYIIHTKKTNYNVNDKISIETNNINKEKSPYEITPNKITIIEKYKVDTNEDTTNNIPDTNIQEDQNTNNNYQEEIQEKPQEENTNSQENYTENDVVTYFEDLDNDLNSYNQTDESLGNKIKSKFVSCIDFIFYDKEIYGIKFKDLTNKTKLKILEIALSIDTKIDSKFPGYKNSISSTYHNIKSKIVEKYLDITTNICNQEPELCQEAKEGFKKLKNSFGITWDFIKQLIGNSTSKLKDWYEIWRYN